MEIGIDSFAKKTQTNEGGTVQDDARAMSELIERIVHADKVGLDVFGLGEHHREEFLDSAAHNILAAAAAKIPTIDRVISAKVRIFFCWSKRCNSSRRSRRKSLENRWAVININIF